MATNAQTIWDRANQMSVLNAENLVSSTQVMDYISLFEGKIFLRAARMNPEYFGVTGSTIVRANFSDSWDLTVAPGLIAAVTRAEVAAIVGTPYANAAVGDRVELVSTRWPDLGAAPRGVLRGRKIYPYPYPYAGAVPELGANNGNMVTQLNIYYSPLPTRVLALTQILTVPDEWADLITYQLAKILAIRDRRVDEEVAMIDEQYNELAEMFDEAVLVYDYGQRRPLMQTPPIPIAPAAPRRGQPPGGGQ